MAARENESVEDYTMSMKVIYIYTYIYIIYIHIHIHTYTYIYIYPPSTYRVANLRIIWIEPVSRIPESTLTFSPNTHKLYGCTRIKGHRGYLGLHPPTIIHFLGNRYKFIFKSLGDRRVSLSLQGPGPGGWWDNIKF